jgi:hypothetical protein
MYHAVLSAEFGASFDVLYMGEGISKSCCSCKLMLDIQTLVAAAQGSQKDKKDEDVFRSSCGLVFFGVPARGLKNASLCTMVRGQPNQRLIETLGSDNDFLIYLQEEFHHHYDLPDSQILCVYETKETRTVIQVGRDG